MDIKDIRAREQAMDPHQSLIVSAPAGSGKTYLLTRRILNLLMHVSCPSHVIAITFTKKAALEMQERLIGVLEEGEEAIAKSVLQRDKTLNWNILNHPEKLSIMTIDAYSGWLLSHSQNPFSSPVSQSPLTLYQNTVYQYYNRDSWSEAQHRLLEAFHGQYAILENLLCSLLATRDQWLSYLQDDNLPSLCTKGIQTIIQDSILSLDTELSAHKASLDSLLNLHEAIAKSLDEPILYPKSSDPKTQYQILANLLLTQSGEVRKSFNKRQGIYPKTRIDDHTAVLQKDFLDTVETLRETLPLTSIEALDESRCLPDLQTIEEQGFLTSLSEVLLKLNQMLQETFKSQHISDFIEVSQKAVMALETDPTLKDFCKQNIHHVLIDEFQDTSSSQYNLLQALIALWPQNEHRTLFAVGDPMQSIYRFRQADVRLFLKLQSTPIHHIQLSPVKLECNFRSSSQLIKQVNQLFTHVLPPNNLPFFAAIKYSQALPTKPTQAHDGIYLHLEENDCEIAQATRIINLIQSLSKEHPTDRIAVLVQARSHLKHIIPLLQQQNIHFNAIDIYPTVNLSAIQDLTALISALIDPYDHLSWYTVLRSPLCGLTLKSLGSLPAGNMLESLEDFSPIQTDQPYFSKFYDALIHAVSTSSNPIHQVWQIWHCLQGESIYPDNQKDAITTWFDTVEKRYLEALPLNREALLEHFKSSYTSKTHIDARLTLLTSHKSKGLEYEHVIIPHLEKKKPAQSVPLFYAEPSSSPIIQPTFSTNTQNINYFKFINKKRDAYESERLLYVAATRAKSTLHLVGHMDETPPKGTWLASLWNYQTKHQDLQIIKDHTEALLKAQEGPKKLNRCSSSIPYIKAEAAIPNSEESIFGTMMHYFMQHFNHPSFNHKWQHYLNTHYLSTGLEDRIHQAISSIDSHSKSQNLNWVMKQREWERNEFTLQCNTQSLIIDRVFLEDDTYYIIDYKFPHSSIPMHTLIHRYQEQLDTYRNALNDYLSSKGIHAPIVTKLYMPIFDYLA